MTRIYANPGYAWRMHGSTVVVVLALVMGLWEVWRAAQAGPEGAGSGWLFALLFLGGGAYALRQMYSDYCDTVVRIEHDGSGEGTVTLWRPFLPKRITGRLDRLSDWRFEQKTLKANLRVPMLLADHPEHPRPLQLELGKGITISDGLRRMAPEAVAAFEQPGG